MLKLNLSNTSWNTPAFSDNFKLEVAQLDSTTLPLYTAMRIGNHVVENKLQVMILNKSETSSQIQVKAGIFFNSIIAGCACADDPTPVSENAEYCEMLFSIDKRTANTSIELCE